MNAPRVRFRGVAGYLPETVVGNDYFAAAAAEGEEEEVFFKGVRERRWSTDGESTVDMGTKAGQKLLEQEDVDPREIDLVMTSALVNDLVLPHAACGIQHGVRATRATAITLDTACASFVSGLIYGAALIKSGFFRKILLIVVSNFAGRAQGRLRDRSAAIPGDGSAALLIERRDDDGEDGLLGWWERSYGQYHGMFAVQALTRDGDRRAFWEPHDRLAFSFDPGLVEAIKKNARELIPTALERAMENAGTSVKDLRLVLTHQPNRYLLDYWREAVGAGPGQVHDTLEQYGNLFQASIPITLADALDHNRVGCGDSIAMASFALAGELVSAAVVQWN